MATKYHLSVRARALIGGRRSYRCNALTALGKLREEFTEQEAKDALRPVMLGSGSPASFVTEFMHNGYLIAQGAPDPGRCLGRENRKPKPRR